MENWKTHVFSLLMLAIFAGLALGSKPENKVPKCNDWELSSSQPLISSVISIDYELTVLDKETNMPVPGMKISYSYSTWQCTALSACPEKCYKNLGDSWGGSGFTNSNGKYIAKASWKPKDEKDQFALYLYVIDDLQIYSRRNIQIDIPIGTTSGSQTTYLLKKNSL